MTSAIPVQCSTNWAVKPAGRLPLCELVVNPQKVKYTSKNMEFHKFELRRLMQRYDWSSQLYTKLSSCGTKAWKISGLNGIRTHDLCDTGGVLYQMGYQANYELVRLWVRARRHGQLPVGLLAQLVKYCTGIAEVMGLNLVQAGIFSKLQFHNCLSCVGFRYVRPQRVWLFSRLGHK